jgi:hypothetical protein
MYPQVAVVVPVMVRNAVNEEEDKSWDNSVDDNRDGGEGGKEDERLAEILEAEFRSVM